MAHAQNRANVHAYEAGHTVRTILEITQSFGQATYTKSNNYATEKQQLPSADEGHDSRT